MKYYKTTTKNGFRIITVPMKNTSAVTLLLLVHAGSRYELENTSGLAHFFEHMVFKGTRKRPGSTAIAREIDKVGGVMNAFTSKEYMGFWIKVDGKHFNLGLDVMSDMVLNPLFQKKYIDTEKSVIFEEINMYLDSPREYVTELWEKLLYGNQPLGRETLGDKKDLNSVSSKDFLEFLNDQFVAKNALFCVAGEVNPESAVNKIKTALKNFKQNVPREKTKTVELQSKPEILLKTKKSDQTHFCLGARTWDIYTGKKHILAVLATILGGNMSSRLWGAIREKHGLAYYIRTFSQHYTDAGYFMAHAGVDNKRIDLAINTVLKEYKKIKTVLVPEDELQKAKDNIKGRLRLRLETTDAWTEYFGMQELLENKISTPEEECKKIDKVTQDDILKVAKEIFVPKRLNLALIGPFKDKKYFEKLLKI